MRGSAKVNRRILGGGTNGLSTELFRHTRLRSVSMEHVRELSISFVPLVTTMTEDAFTLLLVGGVILTSLTSTKNTLIKHRLL